MDAPKAVLMYLVFTRMPGESYSRRLRSLLVCSCDVFPALIHTPCVFDLGAVGLILFREPVWPSGKALGW